MSKPFRFKEFSVEQDKCAMQIGTDGVLLGAWTTIPKNTFSILDIGAGTGVIALQMAQRSQAELIDAIEIEENAYEQCVENFENSPWNDRLFCYHASLEEFTEEIDESYDLIVSNPPFYDEDFTSVEATRNTARFTEALPFSELIKNVAKLLSEKGNFSLIIPHKNQEEVLQLAKEAGLYLQKITLVQGNADTPVKRNLLQFSFTEVALEKTQLVIEKERHQYTQEYKDLVKAFYLKM
ncbi:tRNA1(Val) (adenine(37)-N6)-methyltransferase [Haloflavibacter putidus]|uniref:tRNA1(Val) (adenine(37)-N6)-methyltransferase n=1 Tax=Haloflavibacter putidus TaxID=2576776 RepID=A0A507ZV28_9FLAO|nr:methyltransferase [Haloflavibacter putidus]TQD40471.1 methyltransferase [Haloflavibacter putidus]